MAQIPDASAKRELGARGETLARVGIFACNGEYWTIGFDNATFSLRDVKGLNYIQRLLQHPGEEFHCLDLIRGPGKRTETASADVSAILQDPGVSIGELGDAGEMLDPQAKQDYKRKYLELQEELEDLVRRDDVDRADQVKSEMDFLAHELTRGVGRGGRLRRVGSASERARISVKHTIKAALQKISEHHASFGELLGQSIRTGTFCSYVPSLSSPISWQLSIEIPKSPLGPEATAPVLFRREASFAGMLGDRTEFVGREAERATLRLYLEEAVGGSGRVVMISGAPGVGKTRLAREIGAEAFEKGFLAVSGSCYERDDSVPFMPVVEILEAALTQAASRDVFRQTLGSDAAELARLMPELRRIFTDIPPPLELSPEQSRRILFGAVAEFLARAAGNRPVLLLLEDLHWADEGTLSLLSYVARSVPKIRVMIVGTYRDNELDSGAGLAKTLEDYTRLHLMERVTLHGLPRKGVGDMLRALSGREPPEALVTLIYSNTEGNPFFIEELYRHLVERGKLVDPQGEFRSALDPEDVPQSLRLVIGRRLARLSEEAQKILGTAAMIGRSFTFELLEAATRAEAELLLDWVEEAERAGLITSMLQYPEARFQFSHELVRQAVIANLSAPRRQRLHLRVANAIESIHRATLDSHANDLAHHLWQAGAAADASRTLRYLAMAGRLAIEQSAHKSALLYLNNALELIQKLPDSQERAQTELGIQIDYGLAMLAMKGWYVSEYGDAYKRARELCQGLGGDDPRLFSVLSGLANFHNLIPQFQIARSYGDEMMQLARTARNDEMLVLAHWVSGRSQFFMGDLKGAHDTFELSIQYYDPKKHRTLAFQSGQEPGVTSRIFDAMTLWILGYPEQAEKRAQESIVLARELRSPFTLVNCLCMMAKYDSIRHDFDRATYSIQEGLSLANEYDFGFYKKGLIAYHAIGLAAMGRVDELRAVSRQHGKFSEAGYEVAQTWARSYLAEGLATLGRMDTALALITQAEALMERNEERYVEPEIYRIKGEVTLKQASGSALSPAEINSIESSAEQSFRTAIRIARLQSAKSFELRASLSLSRLLMRDNRQAEAQQILNELYGRFTEGFDMPELKAAKALLDELD